MHIDNWASYYRLKRLEVRHSELMRLYLFATVTIYLVADTISFMVFADDNAHLISILIAQIGIPVWLCFPTFRSHRRHLKRMRRCEHLMRRILDSKMFQLTKHIENELNLNGL